MEDQKNQTLVLNNIKEKSLNDLKKNLNSITIEFNFYKSNQAFKDGCIKSVTPVDFKKVC